MTYTTRQLELMFSRMNDTATYYNRIRTTAIAEAKRIGPKPTRARLKRIRKLAKYMHKASK